VQVGVPRALVPWKTFAEPSGSIISLRIMMQLEEIKKKKQQLYEIAARHGISRIYVFGSVARGESKEISDVDFLIEMDDNVSALGVGAFQYEVQQLLGIKIDVVPTFALPNIEDQAFVRSVRSDSVAI
jgi:predicted nucleotidyltransferase